MADRGFRAISPRVLQPPLAAPSYAGASLALPAVALWVLSLLRRLRTPDHRRARLAGRAASAVRVPGGDSPSVDHRLRGCRSQGNGPAAARRLACHGGAGLLPRGFSRLLSRLVAA